MKRKIKMSRGAAVAFVTFLFFAMLGVTITIWPNTFYGDTIVKVLFFAITSILAISVIIDVLKWTKDNPNSINYRKEACYGPLSFFYADNNAENVKTISYGKIFLLFIVFVGLTFVVELTHSIKNGCVFVYNTSQVLQNEYEQKQEERISFYDNLWKTYQQKGEIAGLNKEIFLEITQIIMENRKDGENTAWKWVNENSPIPFDEFSKFYTDLSSFIEKERKAYFEIEKQCQIIAQKQNTLLDTFPNNFYNKIFLKCERINFEFGFTSDKTDEVFETAKENL